ncbi:MAG: DMT family transporter [Gammaproteobacteria bacterium]|nr:DMT family transporter [Gammaproteobacteria bacterium]
MSVWVLYAGVVLIWGTTWYAIELQLGVVAPVISLLYRVALATVCLFLYALVTRSPLRLSWRNHLWVALQGVLLFSVNYWLIYLGSQYLTSGLVAVLFTMLVHLNLVNARIFFGQPVEPRIVVAATAGVLGVALLFLPEILAAAGDATVLRGAALVLGATFLASLGNMAALRNTSHGLPVVTVNAWGMGYGTISVAVVAGVTGARFDFDSTWSYVGSLLYLAIAGSALAFGLYLALIRRIGAARAAYTSVLIPAVALTVSTVLEGYRWTVPAVAGLLVLLAGNALALPRPARGRGGSATMRG